MYHVWLADLTVVIWDVASLDHAAERFARHTYGDDVQVQRVAAGGASRPSFKPIGRWPETGCRSASGFS